MIARIYKYVIHIILRPLRSRKIQRLWRSKNIHNKMFIEPLNSFGHPFPIDKVKVGNYSYGTLVVRQYGKSDCNLSIGNFCSIAQGVIFILGGEHNSSQFTTYPLSLLSLSKESAFSKGDIVIEDDVWIGSNCLILSGITLAQGTIVAAGSVVVKSTNPYDIVGGAPARFIKKRFDEEIVNIARQIDMSLITEEFIAENIKLFQNNVNYETIMAIYDLLSKNNTNITK